MSVKFKRHDGTEVEAMFHDGTQTSAVGLTVWAGSMGITVNMQFRGGDNNDYLLKAPAHIYDQHDDGLIYPGWWMVKDDHGIYGLDHESVERLFTRIEES